ncbi:hypothetical protein J1N35_014917 [Gossypium stocksii]|uniref:Uncharacterized protein n=1 Tax=Gossypium stocksii TaxID=47602 RepID=A0A9D3VXD7_9ROSI|nr:hypothetical protein J1N35_014917 [Gossypium stocksii]
MYAKEWQTEISVLRRDVRALCLESQDMDWLFFSNNLLAPEVIVIGLPIDFKVPKDMFEGRMDPRAHLMYYNVYMNVLEALNPAKYFLGQFKAHRTIMSTLMGLMSVKQREGKFLQDYVKRFHATTLNTENFEGQ